MFQKMLDWAVSTAKKVYSFVVETTKNVIARVKSNDELTLQGGVIAATCAAVIFVPSVNAQTLGMVASLGIFLTVLAISIVKIVCMVVVVEALIRLGKTMFAKQQAIVPVTP